MAAPFRAVIGGARWRQRAVLLLVLGLGAVLFLPQLGATGLVDETPPLFAAAARSMAESGDWLIPRVNGLPRYDKPPLVYWLMALGYTLPAQTWWNPLGTWAARLPSALAAIATMVLLAATMLRWPQGAAVVGSRLAAIQALSAALAFGLSPLVLLWGRVAVSDALFTALVAASLLAAWCAFAAARSGPWWPCWLALGLAVLAKGPVAAVLLGLTLGLFVVLQSDRRRRLLRLQERLRPCRGLALTALVALPWYGLALHREGEPFWRSFFGYHNLQRFQQVVNNHHQPAWYFAALLLMAALPFTPLLLLGLMCARPVSLGSHGSAGRAGASSIEPAQSLAAFAASWLLAVLLFFSLAATKLPSYWLPATPAAALLVALAPAPAPRRRALAALVASALLLVALSAGLAAAPLWLPWIEEPAIPTLAAELAAGPWFRRAAVLMLLAAGSGLLLAGCRRGRSTGLAAGLLLMQALLVALVPLLLLPLWQLGDRLRGAPLRQLAAIAVRQGEHQEPLAMVGLMKPSLHYYSRRVVLYEGRSPRALLNLSDRLSRDRRPGFQGRPPAAGASVLLVIDRLTLAEPHWQGLGATQLAEAGSYQLLRLARRDLEARARVLSRQGMTPNWSKPRPERW